MLLATGALGLDTNVHHNNGVLGLICLFVLHHQRPLVHGGTLDLVVGRVKEASEDGAVDENGVGGAVLVDRGG